ncbi:MAG: glycosyltransferase N-terminal domain-containing protein, partial [Saprospiraceae bacterium]
MAFLYNLGIYLFTLGLHLAAPFHPKAGKWVAGRRHWRTRYRQEFQKKSRVLWVHAASLGEFEQGRPIIEAWRTQHPDWQIVLTFFSPSGYEVRRQYPQADYIAYLPADTPRNAADFLDIIQPDAAVFVKYEFWFNYLAALRRRSLKGGIYSAGTPTLLVSALFREKQPFFQAWGGFWRRGLTTFTHFFVQNQASARLLQSVGFQNVTVAGDTRIDRVLQIAAGVPENDLVKGFVSAPLAPPSPLVKGGSGIEEHETAKSSLMADPDRLNASEPGSPPFTGGDGGAHSTTQNTETLGQERDSAAPLAPPSPPVKGGSGIERKEAIHPSLIENDSKKEHNPTAELNPSP